MVVLLLIVLGLVLGSFVNALVWRLHEKKNWVSERSECTHCHHQLAARDLVPVVSWLWLKGKCRYCGKPIEDNPVAELLVPALFVLSYFYWPQPLEGAGLFAFVFWLVFLVGFVALAIYDVRWYLLPDKIVFPLIGLAVVQLAAEMIFFDGSWRDLLGAVLGVIILSGLFYALFVFSKGKWIGFGDVKLAIVLGILAGGPLPAVLLLFIASVLGMFFSLPMIFAGKANRKSYVPFGPFLLAAMVIVELFGASLIDWYRGLFLI